MKKYETKLGVVVERIMVGTSSSTDVLDPVSSHVSDAKPTTCAQNQLDGWSLLVFERVFLQTNPP